MEPSQIQSLVWPVYLIGMPITVVVTFFLFGMMFPSEEIDPEAIILVAGLALVWPIILLLAILAGMAILSKLAGEALASRIFNKE